MKMSISIPDPMAREIKQMAKETDRSISWFLQRAWEVARTSLLNRKSAEKSHRAAMKKLASLQGILKDEFPGIDSVTLAHRAFDDVD